VNPGFKYLQSYPFEKLTALLEGIVHADLPPVDLSLGEPKHKTPEFILNTITENLARAGKYPAIKGGLPLREEIRNWLVNRYHLPPDNISAEKHILPVVGTREALFSIAHCIINPKETEPIVVSGNPFYQIYEGAALFAGAKMWYVNTTEENGLLPDYKSVPITVWKQCQLLYICTPNNPTGEVMGQQDFEYLFQLAEKYDFVIAADECYSEIYLNEDSPPLGTLQAAVNAGLNDFRQCLVFHSLSKRSNVPGMRSGFIAGDERLISHYYRYRTYHGCAMSPYIQAASIVAWQDEEHVKGNRELYRKKFDAVIDILSPVLQIHKPTAGFYLWVKTPIDDVEFTRRLIIEQNVIVLPGSYTSREVNGINPGAMHIRIALVAPLEECMEAAKRIVNLINSL
jgi:N-succinyldiaminopimelate aminotransferase